MLVGRPLIAHKSGPPGRRDRQREVLGQPRRISERCAKLTRDRSDKMASNLVRAHPSTPWAIPRHRHPSAMQYQFTHCYRNQSYTIKLQNLMGGKNACHFHQPWSFGPHVAGYQIQNDTHISLSLERGPSTTRCTGAGRQYHLGHNKEAFDAELYAPCRALQTFDERRWDDATPSSRTRRPTSTVSPPTGWAWGSGSPKQSECLAGKNYVAAM